VDKFLITGGKPLCGEVHISGAKNAAVAILPAALLISGKCIIENVPDISDVDSILKMMNSLGADVVKFGRNTNRQAFTFPIIVGNEMRSCHAVQTHGAQRRVEQRALPFFAAGVGIE